MQNKSIHIFPNRTKIWFGFFVCLVLAIICGYILLYPKEVGSDEKYGFKLLMLAYIGTPLFIGCGIYALGNLISRKPFLEIATDGIYQHLFLAKTKVYKWENIQKFEVIQQEISNHKHLLLAIHLKNAADVIGEMSGYQKYAANFRLQNFGVSFAIPLLVWQVPAADVIQMLNQFIREQKLDSELQIRPNADDMLVYQSLIKQILLIFIGFLFLSAGIFILYKSQKWELGLMATSLGLIMTSLFAAQFLDKNIRFIYSEKQKNSFQQKQYEELIEKMGDKK